MKWINTEEYKPKTVEVQEHEFYKSEIILIYLGDGNYDLCYYQYGYDGCAKWESFYNLDLDCTYDVEEVKKWCYIEEPIN